MSKNEKIEIEEITAIDERDNALKFIGLDGKERTPAEMFADSDTFEKNYGFWDHVKENESGELEARDETGRKLLAQRAENIRKQHPEWSDEPEDDE